jgi:hypothetical protein
MSFSYPPLTEEEAQKERQTLLDEGTYSFKVNNAISKMSRPKPGKESNPMIELHLTAWDDKGHERYMYDYLVGTRNMAWKLKHFCDAVGLSKAYEDGNFDAWMCVGKSGTAQIGQQKGQPREGGGTYPDKNMVLDYIIAGKENDKGVQNYSATKNLQEDDLPF